MTNHQIDISLYSYKKLKELTEYTLKKIPMEKHILTEISVLIEFRMYELCGQKVKYLLEKYEE